MVISHWVCLTEKNALCLAGYGEVVTCTVFHLRRLEYVGVCSKKCRDVPLHQTVPQIDQSVQHSPAQPSRKAIPSSARAPLNFGSRVTSTRAKFLAKATALLSSATFQSIAAQITEVDGNPCHVDRRFLDS